MPPTGESMTLVFKRAALDRLADPAAAFDDAREWTEVIGLVSDESPEWLSTYADREGIDPDVISSAGGQTGGLAVVRQQFATERHVFLGTTDEDRQFAQSLGWEYLPVEEAAHDAGWQLVEDDDTWQGDGDFVDSDADDDVDSDADDDVDSDADDDVDSDADDDVDSDTDDDRDEVVDDEE